MNSIKEGILNIEINTKNKRFYTDLTKEILDISLNNEIEEFEKAEIIEKRFV